MKIYAEVGTMFQMINESGSEPPEGWIEMLEARPEGEDTADYTAQPDGTWAITQETLNAKLAVVENAWCEEQMARIAKQLIMIEDENPKAEPGTAKQWRQYRIKVMDWVEGNPDFPDQSKRPVAPQ